MITISVNSLDAIIISNNYLVSSITNLSKVIINLLKAIINLLKARISYNLLKNYVEFLKDNNLNESELKF